jgi:hypothetical protein
MLVAVPLQIGVICCGGLSPLTEDGCVSGRQMPCSCDGGTGVSVCNPSGAFDGCRCPPVGDATPVPAPVDAEAEAGPPLPDFQIADPNECFVKENVLYVVAEVGSIGYPVHPESPNPALSKLFDFSAGGPVQADGTVDFFIEPSGYKYGGLKHYVFTLRNLKQTMKVGTIYEDTVDPDDDKTPKPAQEVFGGCLQGETQTGRFIFHELVRQPDFRPTKLTVAFERRCGPFKPALRGCVHWDEANK